MTQFETSEKNIYIFFNLSTMCSWVHCSQTETTNETTWVDAIYTIGPLAYFLINIVKAV